MANIIVGYGVPHSPQLSSEPSYWTDHALRDQRYKTLLGLDGQIHTYEEVLKQAGNRFETANTAAAWHEAYERAQRAVTVIAADYTKLSEEADIVVIVGGDLNEFFLDSGKPALALYLGETLLDGPLPPDEFHQTPPGIKAAMWARHSDRVQLYPAYPEFSRHLMNELTRDGFDLMQVSIQPPGRPLGHSFTFVPLRLGGRRSIRMVPLFVNTYFPPNQPSPRRSLRLGRALRNTIETWPTSERVIVIASGGLSHFVINQDLDLRILDAVKDRALDRLSRITVDELRGGNGEILAWIVAAGALEHLSMEVVDYIPSYRSLAGTGVGMGFARWY